MSDPATLRALMFPSTGLAGTPSVPGAGGAGATSPALAKVKDSAVQFESMLLTQMMKEMQNSLSGDGQDTDGFKAGPLGDVMTSELGLNLSRAGGFGLGTMLEGAMTRQNLGGQTPSAMPLADMMPQGAAALSAVSNGMPDPALLSPATAPAAAPAVSSGFGWRNDPIDGGAKFHKGLDVPMPVGTPVRTPADGRVVSVGQETGYGLTVVVAHANGLESRYAHLSAADVHPGDTVQTGAVIARSGNSGRSTGPHLHFEVLDWGQPVDPQVWLGAVAGTAAGMGQ